MADQQEDGGKHPGGRPPTYREEFVEQAKRLCQLGARDVELADFFHVTTRSINLWKVKHPDFGEALKVGKEVADDAVEQSLYKRATGYSHEVTKINVINGEVIQTPVVEHFPPDATSMIFWLKNRRPAAWRDKHEVETAMTIKPTFDASKLTRDERQQMRALLLKASPEDDGMSAGPPA